MISVVKDMIIYIPAFSISIFFMHIAQHYINKNKFLFVTLSAISMFFPCFLAGARADTVGTDLKIYAEPTFQNISSINSFSQVIDYSYYIELGYCTLAYLISRFTNSLAIFLAASQLIVIIPLYVVACKRNDRAPAWLSMAVYYCVFFGASMNIMRQSISAAFLLLAVQLFEEKKTVRSIIFCVVAWLFHNSTFIGILIYILSFLIQKIKKGNQIFAIIFMSATISIITSQWKNITNLAISMGLLSSKYKGYVNVFSGFGYKQYLFTLGITQYVELLFCIAFAVLGLIWILSKKNKTDIPHANSYSAVMVICASIRIMVMILLHSSYGVRITFSNEYILMIMMPCIAGKNGLSLKKITINGIIIIVLIIGYLVGYAVFGWHGIHPYKFAL